MSGKLTFGSITPDKLRHNLAPNGAPHMIHPKRSADLLGIIQRLRGIAIRDDEDVFGWEDLQGGRQGGGYQGCLLYTSPSPRDS